MCSSSRRCGTTRPGAACRYANHASRAYASQVTRSRRNSTASTYDRSRSVAAEAAAAHAALERVFRHVDGQAVVEAHAPAARDPARLPDDDALGADFDALGERLRRHDPGSDLEFDRARIHDVP